MNNNRIITFDSKTFFNFEHLDYLDLSYNLIIEIWVQNINKLILNNVALKELHINGSVEILIVNNNFLKGVDIHDETDLRTLEIRNNSIENIANFSNAFLIENFDISANNLKTIDAGKLFNYPRLKSLKLAATELNNLTDETFMFQSDLKELDLSHNYLTYITNGLLETMKNLEKLSISSNNIKSFDYEYLHETHTRLKEIDLQYNDWNCSYLFNMLQYFQNNGILIKTDYKHKIMKNKSQINGIFCNDDNDVDSDKYSSTTNYKIQLNNNKNEILTQNSKEQLILESFDNQNKKNNRIFTIIILIFIIVLILFIVQILNFVKLYIINRSGYLRNTQSIIHHHSRLMEETEHL